MNKEAVLSLGFKELPYYTILDSLVYELPRDRVLSLGCLGTPNETLSLCERSKVGDHYTDLICIYNFDYDGYITKEALVEIIGWFTRYNKVRGGR